MEKIVIVIEKSKDHYSAYAENCEGIYAAGDTVEEAKRDVLEAIRLLIENQRPGDIPEILKGEYQIEYHFDAPSFLKHYSKIFTKSALERMTGINQRQLVHYVSGFRNPSKKTIEKIDNALHRLADELSQVHLV